MNETFSLQEVYRKMSCFSVMGADFKDRCSLAMSVKHCGHIMNFFKYYEILYCGIEIQNQVTELAVIITFVLIAIILMITTAYLVDKYFAPTLKIIAVKLNMNEYLAGVTLLAFGNTSPDLMANLMPVRKHAPLFTITISNSLALILISGGMVCYTRSFKINGHCALRDLLFVLLACELLIFVMLHDPSSTAGEGIALISLYIVNLIVVLMDRKLVGRTIIKLHNEIDLLLNESVSVERDTLLRTKITKLRELELDQILIVRHRHNEANLMPSSHSFSRTRSLNGFSTRKNSELPPAVNLLQTRNSMYHPRNRKNKSLFIEFFKDLVPVDLDKWNERGWLRRSVDILLSPIALPCCIFIPVVDYSRKKHGWSKLLNCTQIITNPFMFIILTQAMITNEYDHWHLSIDYNYASWSLCVTVPLAVVAFIHTRTDMPPPYHILFVILTASSSMLMIAICATELEVLCCIIGVVFHMSESFVASSIRSFSAAVTDMIMNLELAMQGYDRMAFAATLAGPFFCITICMGVPMFFQHARHHGTAHWLFGEHGANCYYFFLLTIFTTLMWTITFNFFARRSAAVFAFTLYLIFILYAVLVEWGWIHEFADDLSFEPK
ncbi:mitochondrial sodium/calcium exchanger protein [Drosophila virilis]|uniref:Sodium/calcium exchanger membrane region domain-containing protein n=1 Tax=Drosophila virilis TaxID=7244 RepID=A0A0Q9W467_DROVI|nr:mitochondrial sodium/calcium exchanger protein [Drosophila virilis]KRF79757.1 uncharacterized protein Dvir_GJ25849 [Drosophila virilis]